VDAGFTDLEIIPIGADKVFIRSMSRINISVVVKEARPFFDLVFS